MWNPIGKYKKEHFGIHPGEKNALSALQLFNIWCEGKGITQFAQVNLCVDWCRTLKAGRMTNVSYRVDPPPFLDHAFFFKNPHYTENSEPSRPKIWLAYHPYRKAEEIRAEIWKWATSQGLRSSVYEATRSWYYPGETCLVVIEFLEL